jgi:hypothetical protein
VGWVRRLYDFVGFLGAVSLAIPATLLVWSVFAPANQRSDLWAGALCLAAFAGANVAFGWAQRRHQRRRGGPTLKRPS